METQVNLGRGLITPWLIASVVTIGTFMEVLDTSIANVALPHIAGSLSASQDEGAWVLTSYLVANAIVLPISGWLSAFIGRKNFYLASVILFTVFSALCGLAPSLGALILFRALQGLAGGGLQPSVQAILADTFSPRQRGMGMALYTIAILCAPVLGPTLGGWITDSYSWRWIFYINIPTGIICAMLTRIVLKDPEHMEQTKAAARKRKIDWLGLGLIAIGLAALEIVLDKGQELDWFGSDFVVFFTIVAIVSLVSAVLWELQTPHPVVNLRLLKERNFVFCCVIILGIYGILYATTYLLPLYMQQMLGYQATTAGLVLSPAGLLTMIEVPLVGIVLTRGFDPRKLVFAGFVLFTTGIFMMSILNLDIAPANIIIPRTVQALGVGLITVPISTVVFAYIPATERSQAAGLYALVRNEGASLGIALVSTMLQRRSQVYQVGLAQNLSFASPGLSNVLSGLSQRAPYRADATYYAIARLYGQLLRQAALLSYMDQFRMLAGMMFFLFPALFFLKRSGVTKKTDTLEVH